MRPLWLLSGLALLACGGGSTGPEGYADGRVFVEHRLVTPSGQPITDPVRVEVKTYLPEVGEVPPFRLMPGERRDVVGKVLKGGTKFTIVVTGEWYDGPTTEIEVTVDGNVTVVLTEHPHKVGATLVPIKYRITYE